MENLGFIGLGVMGNLMCRRLLKLGVPVFVYDIDSEAVAKLESDGAIPCGTPKEVAEKSDYILSSLPNANIIEMVALGTNGVVEGIKSGSVFIDLSSSTPMVTEKIGKALKVKDVDMLDSPVSRGASAARDGTLSIMVGGREEVMRRCFFIFEQLGSDIIHVGKLGAGHSLKALNNLLSATNTIAACEGTLIAAQAGIDPDKLLEVINGSSGASHITSVRFPKYFLNRNFNSNFTIGLMHKDISIAQNLAQHLKAPLYFTSLTQQIYTQGLCKGLASEDNTKILEIMEDIMKTKLVESGEKVI